MQGIDESVFKGYDIRGIYPISITPELAEKVGQAFANVILPQGGTVAVGEDVRVHSRELKNALIQGLLKSGVKVYDLGLILTDMMYFSVGFFEFDAGIQVTASHNPAEWNGFKMVRKGPIAISYETGIEEIKNYILSGKKGSASKQGLVEKIDVRKNYLSYILSFLKGRIGRYKVVINSNFGPAGKLFLELVKMGNLPLEVIPLNIDLDGSFPKGRPDPLIPENREELKLTVYQNNADFGIAWDADGDRVFFCANGGVFIEPYYSNTLLIEDILKTQKGAKIIFDPRYIWAIQETILKNGGVPVISRVGHSYIKQKMRQQNAVLGVESSGHIYYKDFWYSDSGMIPPMQILNILSAKKTSFLNLLTPIMQKYYISGEINSKIKDAKAKIEEIEKLYKDAKISKIDGIACEYPDYRFVVRASNTEPLIRLTLEAKSEEIMKSKTEEILKIIRSES